jgi:hypothetical protein
MRTARRRVGTNYTVARGTDVPEMHVMRTTPSPPQATARCHVRAAFAPQIAPASGWFAGWLPSKSAKSL